MNCGLKTIQSVPNITLEESVTMEEIFQAVKQVNPNKTPG